MWRLVAAVHGSWAARAGLTPSNAAQPPDPVTQAAQDQACLDRAEQEDLCKAQIEQAASSPAVHLEAASPPPSPKKRKVGRPAGTYGGSLARAAVRQAASAENAGGAAMLAPAASCTGSPVLQGFNFVAVGSTLQKQLFLFSHQQHSSTPILNKNVASDMLFQGRRPVASLAALANEAGRGVDTMSNDQQRVASAGVLASGYLWGTLFAKAQDLIEHHGWAGILFGRARKYDETPHRIRLLQVGPDEALVLREDGMKGQASSTGTAAKILQSRLAVFMLLRHAATARYLLLTGHVPCPLQTVDATTAENIKASQQRVEALAVCPAGLAGLFKWRVTLACSDRAASNLAAERSMRWDAEMAGQKTYLVHTACDIHKLGTCEKTTLALVSSHVSGMLSIGLATRLAGSTQSLRRHLLEILQERLRVRIGPPQCVEYRQKVYDCFLEDLSTVHSEQAQRRRSKQLLRQKQRMILDRYLNGNLDDEEITHWSLAPVDRESVLKDFARFVIPALMPHCCPVLNRSKFMGFESSAAWTGLLSVHHNLLSHLMTRFHGREEDGAARTGV